MRTLLIQSYRAYDVPPWIARCLASVRAWALASGFDYELAGDETFQMCGADYLAAVGDNVRSITNLSRLLLVQAAHAAGYDRAIWMDADIFVFAPERLRIDLSRRYGFAREVWMRPCGNGAWQAQAGVNNSVFACMAGEPDLEWFILTLRHIARHREVWSNYQVGGHVIKGMQISLGFDALEQFGMFSPEVVEALARGWEAPLHAQARFHGAPVYAANLCAGEHYGSIGGEAALAAMDVLERTQGDVVNAWLAEGALSAQPYPGATRFRLAAGQPAQERES